MKALRCSGDSFRALARRRMVAGRGCVRLPRSRSLNPRVPNPARSASSLWLKLLAMRNLRRSTAKESGIAIRCLHPRGAAAFGTADRGHRTRYAHDRQDDDPGWYQLPQTAYMILQKKPDRMKSCTQRCVHVAYVLYWYCTWCGMPVWQILVPVSSAPLSPAAV